MLPREAPAEDAAPSLQFARRRLMGQNDEPRGGKHRHERHRALGHDPQDLPDDSLRPASTTTFATLITWRCPCFIR
jgi:hypothetical protein